MPEWGEPGEPLVVTFSPMTMRERARLAQSAKGNDAAATVLVVIRHAKDAEGNRLFTEDAQTRKALENDVDPAVLARIAYAITHTTPEDDLGES